MDIVFQSSWSDMHLNCLIFKQNFPVFYGCNLAQIKQKKTTPSFPRRRESILNLKTYKKQNQKPLDSRFANILRIACLTHFAGMTAENIVIASASEAI